MKLGFNLLLWTTHVVEEHVPLFQRLKATGYDGVEIPLFEGDVAHYERLGRNLKDAGLGSSAVTVLPTGNSTDNRCAMASLVVVLPALPVTPITCPLH